MRYRGDPLQAAHLERWLNRVTSAYAGSVLAFNEHAAHVWGHLRVPHSENSEDKQIAATALIYDLVVVTRNCAHFQRTGVKLLNPFTSWPPPLERGRR